MLKKLLGALALSLTCSIGLAADGGAALDKAPDRITDMAALQNGARLFVNYCLNCHSANSMRYNKLLDLGLSEDEIKKNLLFTSDKIGDLMHVALTPEDAKKWFGAAPPDLSVIARAKSTNFGPSGTDYVYTYLRTFYRDATRKTGWNNVVFPSVGMPHALWELEGHKVFTDIEVHQVSDAQGNEHWERTTTVYDADGNPSATSEVLAGFSGPASRTTKFEPVDPKLHAAYDNDAADLSNFLAWMAEPGQVQRKQIGVWVMLFLLAFLFVAVRMNAQYWKHVR